MWDSKLTLKEFQNKFNNYCRTLKINSGFQLILINVIDGNVLNCYVLYLKLHDSVVWFVSTLFYLSLLVMFNCM